MRETLNRQRRGQNHPGGGSGESPGGLGRLLNITAAPALQAHGRSSSVRGRHDTLLERRASPTGTRSFTTLFKNGRRRLDAVAYEEVLRDPEAFVDNIARAHGLYRRRGGHLLDTHHITSDAILNTLTEKRWIHGEENATAHSHMRSHVQADAGHGPLVGRGTPSRGIFLERPGIWNESVPQTCPGPPCN